MNLDRTIAPAFGKVEKLNLIKATSLKLDNGIDLHYINAGTQDVVKLEIIFKAGKYYQTKPLVASSTCSLLDDGTSKHSASEIADKIDFFGAFFGTKNNYDFADLTLHCQSKHLVEILPLLLEMISDANFPESELALFKHNGKAKLIQELERVEVIASNVFNEVVFGKEHPYGYSNNPSDYDSLDQKGIAEFHKKHYQLNGMQIVVSGRVNDSVINDINRIFGLKSMLSPVSAPNGIISGKPLSSSPEKKHFIRKENAVQSAIRIGKPLFNKTHPDYHGMIVLNTLLGGYFGSRLMSNIREDKGYTYGIHSSLSSYTHAGCLSIATEVGAEVTGNAVKEIFSELKKLREEFIGKEELDLVRNYLLGSFMRSIDGPFGLADRFVGIHNFGLGYEFYDHYFDTVKTITPEKLISLARQYFSEDSFYTVVAGSEG